MAFDWIRKSACPPRGVTPAEALDEALRRLAEARAEISRLKAALEGERAIVRFPHNPKRCTDCGCHKQTHQHGSHYRCFACGNSWPIGRLVAPPALPAPDGDAPAQPA
jgi:predicted RNA-binding Zn-ribbon protein involved in translation (DUF1610 family)